MHYSLSSYAMHMDYCIDNDDTQLDNIYTHINLTTLRRECGDLDNLLVLSKDIEFKEVLGEGILICMYNVPGVCGNKAVAKNLKVIAGKDVISKLMAKGLWLLLTLTFIYAYKYITGFTKTQHNPA